MPVEIRIKNVNAEIKEGLKNIARNQFDMDLNPYLKMKIREIYNNASPELKIKKPD
jgi:hypothetical protein